MGAPQYLVRQVVFVRGLTRVRPQVCPRYSPSSPVAGDRPTLLRGRSTVGDQGWRVRAGTRRGRVANCATVTTPFGRERALHSPPPGAVRFSSRAYGGAVLDVTADGIRDPRDRNLRPEDVTGRCRRRGGSNPAIPQRRCGCREPATHRWSSHGFRFSDQGKPSAAPGHHTTIGGPDERPRTRVT